MKKFTLLTTLIILYSICNLYASTSYTWTGNTSTNWATSSNWSPSGVPSSGDIVTIPSTTRQPLLDQARTIGSLSVTNDTLNLNGYTLTISGSNTPTFTSGFINNGTLLISSASSAKFLGTNFGATLSVNSSSIEMSGGNFGSTVTLIKTGSTNDVGKGNCVFNYAVTVTDSATGSITFGNSNPDTIKTGLTVNVKGSGSVYLAHNSTGNFFGLSTTVTLSSSGFCYFNYYGTSEFDGDLVLNRTGGGGGGIIFGYGKGSSVLDAGNRLKIGSGGYSSGLLYLRNFTQSGSSDTTHLTLTGTSTTVEFEAGSVWDAPVIVSSPSLYLEESHFNGTSDFTRTGSAMTSSAGGNYFGGGATITNNSSSTGATPGTMFILSNSEVDTFASVATITNATGLIEINNALFQGNTTISNTQTTSNEDRVTIAVKGNVEFAGNLVLSDTVGGIIFGSGGGTTSLDLYAVMSLNSTYTGNLTLNNFSQYGPDTVYIPMKNSDKVILNSCYIEGTFKFIGKHIDLNSSIFESDVYITRNLSSTVDSIYGGNDFYGTLTIADSSASGKNLRLSTSLDDYYYADVSLNQKSAALVEPAYSNNSFFSGNIEVNGTSAIGFGTGGGKVILSDGNSQSISNSGSYTPSIKKLEINKSGGGFTLSTPLTVSDSLVLTSGIIYTDTTNLLLIPDNGIAIDGNDASFVNGPVKKTGNDAFTFPLGDSSLYSGAYHPLRISAPSSTSDAYTAQYFAAGQTLGSSAENTIENVSSCEYWKLDRKTGSSTDTVSLGWNSNSCNVNTLSDMRVAFWNGTKWADKGNGGTIGNTTTGTVRTSSAVSSFGNFTLADNVCSTFHLSVSSTDAHCHYIYDGSATATAFEGTAPYVYSWSSGQTTASINDLSAGYYTVTATDANGCLLTNSVHIYDDCLLSLINISGPTRKYNPVTHAMSDTTVIACTPDTFSVFLSGISASTDTMHIVIHLPVGISLINYFYPAPNDTMGDTLLYWGYNDTLTVRYGILAGCASFQANTSSLSDIVIYWKNQDTSYTTSLSHSYTLNAPVISLQHSSADSLQLDTTNYNVPYNRYHIFKNTGTTFRGYLFWKDTMAQTNSILRIDDVKIIRPDSTLFPSVLTFHCDSAAWVSAHIDSLASGDSLIIQETVTLTGCPSSSLNLTVSKANLFYGCDSLNACAQANPVAYYDNWVLNIRQPRIHTIELDDFFQADTLKWKCPSTVERRCYRVTNTGGAADSMRIAVERANWLGDQNISYFWKDSVVVFDSISGVPGRNYHTKMQENFLAGPASYFFYFLPDTATPWFYAFSVRGAGDTSAIVQGDTLYIEYNEYKLCLDTVDSNFNHGVRMNLIDVYDTLSSPCYCAACWDAAVQPKQEFSLQQLFLNNHPMLGDGDTAMYDIENQSQLSLNSLLSNLEVAPDPAHLFLKIELAIDSGLKLLTDSLFLYSMQGSMDTTIYANTIIYHWNHGVDTSLGETVTAIFKLPSDFFTSNSSGFYYGSGFRWRKTNAYERFFNHSYVRFYVKADCQHMPTGGFSHLKEKFYVIYDSTCTPPCELPLASKGARIKIHCPGCTVPGWNISQFDMKRINTGWADNDNNNHPDSLNSGQPYLNAMTPPANNWHIMMGDTLQIRVTANTSDGDTCLVFSQIGFDFTHAWLDLSGSFLSKLRFVQGTGKMLYPSDSILFSVPPPEITSGEYFYFSLDTLNAHRTGGGFAPARFDNGDLIFLDLQFVVDSNIIDAGQYFSIEELDGLMYMSGVERTDTMPVADPGGSNLFYPTDSSTWHEYSYWCTGGAGTIAGIGFDFRSGAVLFPYHDDSQGHDFCYKQLYYTASLDVGEQHNINNNYDITNQAALNSFSYEVRDFMLLDSITFPLPSGWVIDKAELQVVTTMLDTINNRTVYDNLCPHPFHYPDTMIHYFADSVTLYPYHYYSWFTSQLNPLPLCTDTIFDIGDETKRIVVTVLLQKSNVCDTPFTQNFSGGLPVTAYLNHMPQNFGGSIADRNIVSGLFTVPHDTALQFQLLPSSINLSTTNFNTTLTITTPNNFANQDRWYCPNAFFYPVSPSGLFTVDSIQYTADGYPTVLHPAIEDSISNLPVYNIGHLSPYFGPITDNVKIFMHYACLPSVTDDSILFYYGCNCYNYPTSLADACILDSIYFHIHAELAGMQIADTINTITRCDTLTYAQTFTATNLGYIHHISDTVIFDSSLTQVSSTVTFNSITDTITPVIHGDTLIYSFYGSPWTWLDTAMHNGSSFVLTIQALTNCNYTTGSNMIAIAHATSYCGQDIRDSINRPPLTILPGDHCSPHCWTVSVGNDTTICATFSDTLIATATGIAPFTYLWYNSSTSDTLIVTPSATTTYWVIVTDSTGASVTDSVTVTVVLCPCIVADTTVPDSSFSTSYGSGFSHESVIIQGRFFINNTFTFDSCDVRMLPDAQIIVMDTNILTIDTSHVYSCTDMWQRIFVDSLATLRTHNSLIEDARHAVWAHDGSTVTTINTWYNANLVGIYVPVHSTSGYNTVNFLIRNCKFSYENLQTFSPDTTVIGIYLNDLSSLTLPGNGVFYNKFDSLNYGVYALNSNVQSFHSKFTNIIDKEVGLVSGVAIYASSVSGAENLYVSGYVFDTCFYGVYATNMKVKVLSTQMAHMKHGITVGLSHSQDIRIQSNTISADMSGIELLHNGGAGQKDVADNNITIVNSIIASAKGITVQEDGNSNTSFFPTWLFSNTVNMLNQNIITGIELNTAQGYGIKENDVHINDIATPAKAISLTASNQSRMTCNLAYGDDTAFVNTDQVGVYTSDCLDYYYKCNLANETYDGFLFDGVNWSTSNTGATFESNDIKKHFYGLHVKPSGRIGQQFFRGNLWYVQNYTSFNVNAMGAINENDTSVQNDQFKYKFGVTWSGSINNPTPVTGGNWFQFFLGTDSSCGVSPNFYCPNDTTIGSGSIAPILPSDILIANDSVHSVQFDEQTVWKARRALMEKLLSDTSLITSDSTIHSFYNSFDTTNIKYLSDISLHKKSLNDVDSSTIVDVRSNFDIIDRNTEAIAINDSLIDIGGGGYSIDDLITENENREDSILSAASSNQSTLSTIQSSISDKADDIYSDNISLSSDKIYETNEITVNSIYLSTIAKGIMYDGGQASTLYDIAVQCPLIGGPSVYQARSLYYLTDDQVIYDDASSCSGSPRGVNYSNTKENRAPVRMYPNPTNGKVTLIYSLNNPKGKLELFNSLGTLIRVQELNNKKTKLIFDVSGVANSVLYYRVMDDETIIGQGKLVIIK